MAECPKCKRDSLEYSEGKRAAWCLYSDCTFNAAVKDYNDYAAQFERPVAALPDKMDAA
jgi:hypothetical protein